MSSYIEFVKIYLPDIIAFTLIAIAYISQIVGNIKGKKSSLLTRSFFIDKTKLVDNACLEVQLAAEQIKKQMAEIIAENIGLKVLLEKAEQAIKTICEPVHKETDDSEILDVVKAMRKEDTEEHLGS